MKHIFLTSILILFTFSVFTAEKDSLQNLLSNATGDQKIELMIELAENISNDRYNDAMILLKGADELAIESGNIKLEAKV
ncbi:MAG: hypothetical protein KAH33_02060, partial [Candidatus Delongbacteria bacterium]|nr:hypothetical protein [Candidatus Delongbacteria bacterium]